MSAHLIHYRRFRTGAVGRPSPAAGTAAPPRRRRNNIIRTALTITRVDDARWMARQLNVERDRVSIGAERR